MHLPGFSISRFLNAVISAVLWAAVGAISCFAFFFGGLVFFPIIFVDRKRAHMHRVASYWGKAVLFAARPIWTCRVKGLDSVEKGRHYVIVSNHQSMLDILILLAVLPLHFKFIAKKELFAIPVIGWQMGLANYIAVDRQNLESRKKGLRKAEEWLSKNVSVLFFPEGTRSPNGEIQRFKEGAFRAAREQGVPILPVVLDGTWNAFPKRSWRIQQKACFDVSIGQPVFPRQEEPVTDLGRKIHREMKERLENLRKGRR